MFDFECLGTGESLENSQVENSFDETTQANVAAAAMETVGEIISPTKIKVVGCGGGGSSAVNRMIDGKVSNVDFVVLNTDKQALSASRAATRMVIGEKLTGGLGAGGKPSVGEEAAEEDKEAISEMLKNTDMVFVTAGMGGGTGTGSAPVVARIARELGILTVGVVTTPFEFEGWVKMRQAEAGIEKLRKNVDSLIVIPNQKLLKMFDQKNVSMKDSFLFADDILKQAVQGISDIVTKHGDINVDFADVSTVMKNQDNALLGVGVAEGENRAIDAATNAIKNPLLEDMNIDGATNFLVHIAGGESVGPCEVNEIMNIVKAKAAPEDNTIFGLVVDPALGEKIRVTVIATGFQNKNQYESRSYSEIEKTKTVNDGSLFSQDEYQKLFEPSSQGFSKEEHVLTERENFASDSEFESDSYGDYAEDFAPETESIKVNNSTAKSFSKNFAQDNYNDAFAMRRPYRTPSVNDNLPLGAALMKMTGGDNGLGMYSSSFDMTMINQPACLRRGAQHGFMGGNVR